jgi:hypothetical protein
MTASSPMLLLFSFFERSILMSFPWRELGGGGFFLSVVDVCCVFACGLCISPSRWSSPSASDISCEVLGVSWATAVSKIDCRDTDEASVMLAASAACDGGFNVPGLDTAGDGTIPEAFACPVMSSLLKASTSSEPFPPTKALGGCGPSVDPCSISSSVFLNGFGGGRPDTGGVAAGTL